MATTKIITDIREAIPQRGVWYQYYDDIFVSVVPTEKRVRHIRRKTIIDDDKKIDHKTCPWHLDWQYKEIEANYGYPKLGKKTYEVQITVDNEIHRIDSLVENIAIEFQHTLSVSSEEMNSRYIAHKKKGYIPYLVIDLTEFSYDTFKASLSERAFQVEPLKLKRYLSKWIKTNYCQNNNLFLDLEDALIRLSDYFRAKHLKYKKGDFVNCLLSLETKLEDKRKEEQKKNEEIEKQRLLSAEKARERELETARRELERAREENTTFKNESNDYKYYRVCLADNVIRPYIEKYELDRFRYYNESKKVEESYEKYHIYYSLDNTFEIQYKTVGRIEIVNKSTYVGTKQEKEYKYLFAEIEIIEGKYPNRKVFNFLKKQDGETILIPEYNLTF